MFYPVWNQNLLVGHTFRSPEYLVFFGSKNTTQDSLKTLFNYHDFKKLKQVHGDLLIESKESTPEDTLADAHWTSQKGLGLLIQTADCLPVFIYDLVTKRTCGIHAGWKGVVNRIVPKSLLELYTPSSQLEIFIGPAIKQSSFEIDQDVCLQLQESTKTPNNLWIYSEKTQKYYYDLKATLRLQIEETQIPFNLRSLDIDTFTDLSFSSFRREKGPCRNWSFILKSNRPDLPFA